ncbi:MAG: hypothetical protein PHV05_10060, partial [Candidatus Riflebacteria bacterium]|nr:hypothetical protein [Candidatus Riflebacteria bacterium]
WPLQSLYSEARAAGKDINDYVEYKVEIVISSKGKNALVDEAILNKLMPMMTGDKPVVNPMAIVDSLTVTCDYLSIDKSEGLKSANFEVERKSEDGKQKLDRYIWKFDYAAVDKGQTSHSWFVPKDGTFQYIPKVTFLLHKKNSAGKNQVLWEYNGKNLLGEDGYGYLELDPGDEAWDPDDEF